MKGLQKAIRIGLEQLVYIHLVNKGIKFKSTDISVTFRNHLIEVDLLDRLEFVDATVGMLEKLVNFIMNEIPDSAQRINRDKLFEFLKDQLVVTGLPTVLFLDNKLGGIMRGAEGGFPGDKGKIGDEEPAVDGAEAGGGNGKGRGDGRTVPGGAGHTGSGGTGSRMGLSGAGAPYDATLATQVHLPEHKRISSPLSRSLLRDEMFRKRSEAIKASREGRQEEAVVTEKPPRGRIHTRPPIRAGRSSIESPRSGQSETLINVRRQMEAVRRGFKAQ